MVLWHIYVINCGREELYNRFHGTYLSPLFFILKVFVINWVLISVAYGQAQKINSVGKIMPPDAAPLSQQTIRLMGREPRSLDSGINPYDDDG